MNNLVIKLMQEIGLDVNSLNNVVDQDYLTVLTYETKILKYSLDGVPFPINYFTSYYFNPLFDVKLMDYLFKYYLGKLDNLDERAFSIFYPVNSKDGTGYIEIKETNGNIYRSKSYRNICLRYIDLLFRISGEEKVDLSQYDIK